MRPIPFTPLSGGRTWWAHFEFTRINIEPIILRKKIEGRLVLGADVRLTNPDSLWKSRVIIVIAG